MTQPGTDGDSDVHSKAGQLTMRDARFVAHCECGWTSPPQPTAGLAHAAFDAHLDVTGVAAGP
jgi:hypothetical protein